MIREIYQCQNRSSFKPMMPCVARRLLQPWLIAIFVLVLIILNKNAFCGNNSSNKNEKRSLQFQPGNPDGIPYTPPSLEPSLASVSVSLTPKRSSSPIPFPTSSLTPSNSMMPTDMPTSTTSAPQATKTNVPSNPSTAKPSLTPSHFASHTSSPSKVPKTITPVSSSPSDSRISGSETQENVIIAAITVGGVVALGSLALLLNYRLKSKQQHPGGSADTSSSSPNVTTPVGNTANLARINTVIANEVIPQSSLTNRTMLVDAFLEDAAANAATTEEGRVGPSYK